jgi:hypothetical protein
MLGSVVNKMPIRTASAFCLLQCQCTYIVASQLRNVPFPPLQGFKALQRVGLGGAKHTPWPWLWLYTQTLAEAAS